MGLSKRLKDVTHGGRGIDFRLDPVDERRLHNLLSTISSDMQKKISRKALRAGGKIFIIDVKRRSPSDRVESGIKMISRTSVGVPGIIIGASVGLPNPAWFEFGTNKFYIGNNPKAGRGYYIKSLKRIKIWDRWYTLPSKKYGNFVTGGIKPIKFIKTSWDASKRQVSNKIEQVIKQEIENLR